MSFLCQEMKQNQQKQKEEKVEEEKPYYQCAPPTPLPPPLSSSCYWLTAERGGRVPEAPATAAIGSDMQKNRGKVGMEKEEEEKRGRTHQRRRL